MSTSGVRTFTVQEDELIKSALLDVRAVEAGSTIPAILTTQARLELNFEVQALMGEGIKLWSREWVTGLNTVADTQTFTMTDSDILAIDDINIIQTGTSIPCDIIDIQEFFKSYGGLDTKGRPTSVGIEQTFADGTYKYKLRFYPTPDDAYEFHVLLARKLDDFTGSTDNPAFPTRWYDALRYGLCLRLAPRYGAKVDRLAYFERMYEKAKSNAKKSEYTSRTNTLRGAYRMNR